MLTTGTGTSTKGHGGGMRLSTDAMRLIDDVNIAHLATLMDGGEPKVEPVWVLREGDHILVTTDAKSIKARNAGRDGRVALSITSRHDPYDQLLVRGRVTELRGDPDLAVLDAMSEKYLGRPFPRRRWSDRVVMVIEPAVARAYRSPLSALASSAPTDKEETPR